MERNKSTRKRIATGFVTLMLVLSMFFSGMLGTFPSRVYAADSDYKVNTFKIDGADYADGSQLTVDAADKTIVLNITVDVDAGQSGNELVIDIPKGFTLVRGTGINSVDNNGNITTMTYTQSQEQYLADYPTFSGGENVPYDESGTYSTEVFHTNDGKLTYPLVPFTTSGANITLTLKADPKLNDKSATGMTLPDPIKVSVVNGGVEKTSSSVNVNFDTNYTFDASTNEITQPAGRVASPELKPLVYVNGGTSGTGSPEYLVAETTFTYPTGATPTVKHGWEIVEGPIDNGDGTSSIKIKRSPIEIGHTVPRASDINYPIDLLLPADTFPAVQTVETKYTNTTLIPTDSVNKKAVDNKITLPDLTTQIHIRDLEPFDFEVKGFNDTSGYDGDPNRGVRIGKVHLRIIGDDENAVAATENTGVVHHFDFVERDNVYVAAWHDPNANPQMENYEKVSWKYYGDPTTYTWEASSGQPCPLTLGLANSGYDNPGYRITAEDGKTFEMVETTMKGFESAHNNGGTYSPSCYGRPDYNDESQNNYSVNTYTVTAGGITHSTTFGFKWKSEDDGVYRYWAEGDTYSPGINSTGVSVVRAGEPIKMNTKFHTYWADASFWDAAMYYVVPTGGKANAVTLMIDGQSVEMEAGEFVRDVTGAESGIFKGGKLYIARPKGTDINLVFSKDTKVTVEYDVTFPANTPELTYDPAKLYGLFPEKKTSNIGNSLSTGDPSIGDPTRKIHEADPYGLPTNASKQKYVLTSQHNIMIDPPVGLTVVTTAKKEQSDLGSTDLKLKPNDEAYIDYEITNNVVQGGDKEYAFLPFPRNGQNIGGTIGGEEVKGEGKFDYEYVGGPLDVTPELQDGSNMTYEILYGNVGNFGTITAGHYPNPDDTSMWHASPQAGDNMIMVVLKNPEYKDTIKLTQKFKVEGENDDYVTTRGTDLVATGIYKNNGILDTSTTSPSSVSVEYYQEREIRFAPGDDANYKTPATGGPMASVIKTVGKEVDIIGDPAYAREGYHFAGWKVAALTPKTAGGDGTPITDTTTTLPLGGKSSGDYIGHMYDPDGYEITGMTKQSDGTYAYDYKLDADGKKVKYTMPLYHTTMEALWEPDPQTLKITSNVSGDTAEPDKEFPYTITLKDKDGNNLPEGTVIPYTKSDGTSGNLKVNDKGQAVGDDGKPITLKGGESVTLSDIPFGGKWSVERGEDPGYTSKVKWDNGKTGDLQVKGNKDGTNTGDQSMFGNTEVTFDNIEKEVVPTGVEVGNLDGAGTIAVGISLMLTMTLLVLVKLALKNKKRKNMGQWQ